MAEQGTGVAVEAPSESTLLDAAIPVEQTKYLPDVQVPEPVRSEPYHPLAHINPFWHSNQPSEQRLTSEPDYPLAQTTDRKEKHFSGPLAALEQPNFPEIVEAKPEEPLASVGHADISESLDPSAQNGDLAQLINIDEPSSSHAAFLPHSNDVLAATATLTSQAILTEHVNTMKEHSSSEIPFPTDMPPVEPDGSSEHSHPPLVPTISSPVQHGDHMDTSDESHHPTQAEIWDQPGHEDNQVPVGRTLDVDSSDTDSALGSDTSSFFNHINKLLGHGLPLRARPEIPRISRRSILSSQRRGEFALNPISEDAWLLPGRFQIETDRLDLQHHVWRLTLNGALYLSPISGNIGRVLDVGTGTGIWAIEFAQEHPSVEVIGVDLSPIQPTLVPPNCSFIVDNVEEDWVYDQKFDFIHARMLVLGMHDWPRFFRQSWSYMKPGAWLEMQELQFPVRCADDDAGKESPFREWSYRVMEAAEKVGINPTACEKFEEQLAQQGFVNIRYETIKWPIGSWAKGKKEKEIGRWMLENTLQGLQGVSMALLTRHLGWSREAVELFLVGVRKQILDRSSHIYVDV
ncbi:hypothetical protein MMC26_004457 [Xylographa opegraphella]|nr:hypothetical protein [Xylographa opegraphella]